MTQPSVDAPQHWYLTGASGWFGRTALWEYEQLFGPEALRRDVIAFASTDKSIEIGSPHGPIQARAMASISHCDEPPSGLLHLAFLTKDRLASVGLDEYVAQNRALTSLVADLIRAHPSIPMITTSSGAAAALDGKSAELASNPYATLKQEEEELWRQHATLRMALVLRVYAASGRFLKSPEIFALGNFIAQALAGQQIAVTSPRPVLRSYVHVGTMMRLCWLLLKQPLSPGFVQIDACTHTLSLVELAAIVSKMWNLPSPSYSHNPDLSADNYTADTAPFLSLLKRYGLTSPDLIEQIQETRLSL